MRISVLMACIMSVVLTATACAQTPPLPPAPPEPPRAPQPPEPPQVPVSANAPGETELQDKAADLHGRMADEQKRMADAQRRMGESQRRLAESQQRMAVDAARGTWALNIRGAGTPQPALIATGPMTAEVETEWREDLRVMDKLLSDQLSSAAISSYPQAMGIKLWSLGQSEPMYIEGSGCVFTCRSSVPLAEGSSSATTKRTPQAPPSAWDKAKREISGQGRWEGSDLALMNKQPRVEFDQAALDRLIQSLLKTLPEATNIRHLAPEQFVIVTVLGTDEDGAPLRLTMKAQKSDIDQAAKGSLSAEDFAGRVAHRVR